jgi:hypothetical protein
MQIATTSSVATLILSIRTLVMSNKFVKVLRKVLTPNSTYVYAPTRYQASHTWLSPSNRKLNRHRFLAATMLFLYILQENCHTTRCRFLEDILPSIDIFKCLRYVWDYVSLSFWWRTLMDHMSHIATGYKLKPCYKHGESGANLWGYVSQISGTENLH